MATSPPPADPRDMAFIREVDEAYREDELKRYFHRYGRWVLLAVGIGLAALGAWLWWQSERAQRTDALSEQFTTALDHVGSGADGNAGEELAAIRQSDNPGYRALAAFTEAGMALGQGDEKKAAGLFAGIIADKKAPEALRDAAALRAVASSFETLPPADILQRLAPYLDGDSLWFPVAGEMAAMANLRADEPEKAADLFLRVAADNRAPQSLRSRAVQMAAFLGRDVTAAVEKMQAMDAEAMAAAESAVPAAAVGDAAPAPESGESAR